MASCSTARTVDLGTVSPVRRSGGGLLLLPLGDHLLVDAVTTRQDPHRLAASSAIVALVDAVTTRQDPHALLTMLYRLTDHLCRAGAPM